MNNLELLKQQITEHFSASDSHNMSIGLTWYERAHNECLLLSQVFETDLNKVVGVVAALSPNNKWQRNLHDAWNFLEAPCLGTKVCTFLGQRQKALDILISDGSSESILKILNGDKTKNFYSNIRYYNSSQAVTVDLWAYRSVKLKPSKKNFRITALAYKEVAHELNLKPHQLQAVVWGVIRGAAS